MASVGYNLGIVYNTHIIWVLYITHITNMLISLTSFCVAVCAFVYITIAAFIAVVVNHLEELFVSVTLNQ